MKAHALIRLAAGRDAVTKKDREATYYLRVTVVVALALLAGVALTWIQANS